MIAMPVRVAPRLSRRSAISMVAASAVSSLLPGCATPERGSPVPLGKTAQASVLGVANERFFPALGSEAMEAEFRAIAERGPQWRTGASSNDALSWKLLAISGGGENGAFGAGVLCGWTEQGSRPVFDLVTGVSTGALTAPFAFLGSSYDEQLRTVYTELSPSHVLARRGLISGALFDDALADNAPLFTTISRFLTERMLADIGRAYDGGRLLLIATTDLDAQMPVVWNIGAIARSGHPKALDTVRRVLLASAAVPGAFPPTMFDATLDGQPYQEMHVDGGAFAQAFLYPTAVTRDRRSGLRRGKAVVPATAFVIRNGRLDPEWSRVERQTLPIAGRAISTMIAASGYNDVIRMYNSTLRDGMDFRLAFIGRDFDKELPRPFDQAFMRALFDYGFDRARRGYNWASRPPGWMLR